MTKQLAHYNYEVCSLDNSDLSQHLLKFNTIMKLGFISYKITNPISGGQLYNDTLIQSAQLAGINVINWDGIYWDRINNPVLRLIWLNIFYFFKTFTLSSNDLIVFDIDFHARFIPALLWAHYVRKIQCIGLLHHYSFLFNKGIIANKFHFYLEKFVSNIFDFLIINSNFSYRTFKKLTRNQTPHIILNPYSTVTTTASITEAQYLPGHLMLLQVGTIEERKNILNVIKALSEIKGNFTYNIIGHCHSSTYQTKILDLIAEYSMEEKVFIRGLVDSETLNDYYKKSSVFILVSKLEGYGMVYAEAMHYGLPIIGTTAGAVPELVEHDINGYLCNPEEYIQISEAIANISIKINWDRFHQNNLTKSKTLMDKDTFIKNATDLFRKMKDTPEIMVECSEVK